MQRLARHLCVAAAALLVAGCMGREQRASGVSCGAQARGLLQCSVLGYAALPKPNSPDMSTIDKAVVEMARPVTMVEDAPAVAAAPSAPVKSAQNKLAQSAPAQSMPSPASGAGGNDDGLTTGSVTPAGMAPQRPQPNAKLAALPALVVDSGTRTPVAKGPMRTLSMVVGRAIGDHPQIGLAHARTEEARLGVSIAGAQKKPQMEATLAAGHATVGSAPDTSTFLNNSREIFGNARVDGTLALRQLLFDFGASDADMRKNMRLYDARRLESYDKIEEIAQKVVNAYIKIIESRALAAAADENVTALRRVAQLVQSNQANGNGTVADVQRVQARLVDAITTRSDLNVDMQNAVDQFRRLTKTEPGQLAPLPDMRAMMPAGVEQALAISANRHPALLSLRTQNASMEQELLSQNAQGKPRITAEGDAVMKNYIGPVARTELDVRAMVGLRYKFADGGANRGLENQIRARMSQGAERYRDASDQVEADIRQFYRAIGSSRAKIQSLREGYDASRKVVQLYTEQFQGGKRTLFELLDAQMSLYNARRSMIVNQHEEQRGIYGVLRSVGKLTPAIMRQPG